MELVETHRLVAIEDVDYVNGIADRFRHSGDLEDRRIGLIATAILERLGLKNAPEAATSKGQKSNNITALL